MEGDADCGVDNGILKDSTHLGEERKIWHYQREGGDLASRVILGELGASGIDKVLKWI